MADYFGHFLKGIGSGIQTGLQIAEMRWQKKERERIQKEKEEVMGAASSFNKKLEEFYADKELSKEERQQLDTIYMTSGYNVQELIKGSYEAVVKLDKETEERNLALLKSYREDWGDFDFDLRTIPELYEYYRGETIGEKSKQIFDAGDRLLQKQYEAKQKVVPEISVTERKYNWAIENYKADKISFDELSKYMGAYIAPEEKSAKEQEIDLMKQYGATNEQIKNKLLGITVPKLTPEGEITAGEKRTYDMASSIMFGSSDWVTGISKPGIISTMVSNKLNMGNPLTEEEKTEIRNNYNLIKDTLPSEVISMVESQLQRYGIPLEEPKPIIEGLPISKPSEKPPEPGIIQRGVEGAKKWLGMKGAPKAEEIPTPKVPTGAKEAMIPMMTKKELEDAIRGLDPSDPMYKLLYDEAVKRGYITK